MASKIYDLEERTFIFAKDVRTFVKGLPRTVCHHEDVKQLVRASGSVAANYIEACESLGKGDFMFRMKIARKEAKECRLFLRLLNPVSAESLAERNRLVLEAIELLHILSAILRNTQPKK